MSLSEAIAQMTTRYLAACYLSSDPFAGGFGPAYWQRARHRRYRALCRLRHRLVTEHEALLAATPTVHAVSHLATERLAA